MFSSTHRFYVFFYLPLSLSHLTSSFYSYTNIISPISHSSPCFTLTSPSLTVLTLNSLLFLSSLFLPLFSSIPCLIQSFPIPCLLSFVPHTHSSSIPSLTLHFPYLSLPFCYCHFCHFVCMPYFLVFFFFLFDLYIYLFCHVFHLIP